MNASDTLEPPSAKPSEKVLRELKRQAEYLTQRIHGQYQASRLTCWNDIETMFGIQVPERFHNLPFHYNSLSQFYQFWISSYELRITIAQTESKKLTLAKPKACSTFGSITLRDHQEPVFQEIYKGFKERGIRSFLQDGKGGKGKTYIACAVIRKFIDDGILNDPMVAWRLHPIVVFCPMAVAEKWRRTIETFGMGDLLARRKILIFESSSFSGFLGRQFFEEEEDIYVDPPVYKTILKPTMVPFLTIIDECHEFVHLSSKRTKCIEALVISEAEHFLWMSATPGECINDLNLFVRSIPFIFQGMKVTKTNFEIFALAHDETPNIANAAAMKRLRNTLSSYIISMPYSKPAHKAINIVQVIPFEKSEHKAIYDTLIERYHEVCRKIGKDPNAGGRFKKAIEYNKLKHGVEPLRAYYPAKRAAEDYFAQTYSSIIGCGYKETCASVLFRLVDEYKVPREEISIIWGGRGEIKPEQLVPPEQLSSLVEQLMTGGLEATPEMVKKLKLTLKYREDQYNHGEDSAEQNYRHAKLKEYGLTGVQSGNKRQIEIDNFMSGKTKIAIMTVDTGGVGLDLDRKFEQVWPRRCYFTQIYSGRKFLQLLFRSVREDSISDAEQYILMMEGTVEEWHVAPILDAKLKSSAAFTNRTFDVVDIMECKDMPEHLQRIRSAEEVKADLAAPDAIIPTMDETETENDNDEEL